MLSLSVIFVALGLIAGLARGGKVANISLTSFRGPWLVFVAAGLQIAGQTIAAMQGAGFVFLVASYYVLLLFALINLKLTGMGIVALGLAMNLAVIIPNGAMPVSASAAGAAGFDPSERLQGSLKHRIMGPETKLAFLGDTIPVPLLKKVVSPGDLILGLGMLFLIERLVRYEPRTLRSRPRTRTEPGLRLPGGSRR